MFGEDLLLPPKIADSKPDLRSSARYINFPFLSFSSFAPVLRRDHAAVGVRRPLDEGHLRPPSLERAKPPPSSDFAFWNPGGGRREWETVGVFSTLPLCRGGLREGCKVGERFGDPV